ncbi:PTS system mannose/fructose/sorbose family transporter subunit IID [candidate division KSB1 bacterium]
MMETHGKKVRDNAAGYKLRTIDLISVFIRSLFIQSQFTLKEKHGTGFGFTVLPGLKRISRTQADLKNLMQSHTGFFNSHPFLAPFIAGAVIRIEEVSRTGPVDDSQKITTLKTRFAGALGSLGDRFFWKFLKPAASIIALVIVFALNNYYPWNIIIGASLFLIQFNLFHLYYRLRGVFKGYGAGGEIIRDKSLKLLERMNSLMLKIILFFLGALVVLEVVFVLEGNVMGVIILTAAILISFYLNYQRNSPGLAIIGGLASSIVLFFIWRTLLG